MSWFMQGLNGLLTGTLFDKKRTDAEKLQVANKMFEKYKKNAFSDVPDVDRQEMEGFGENVVFVDCRDLGERNVSSIRDAIPQNEFDLDKVSDSVKIVCYCTIGYRSGVFAGKLRKQHADREIYNLRGGVVRWCHDGGKMVDGEEETNRVHIYDKPWNLLPESFVPIVGDGEKHPYKECL